jgi:hypothetical protein
VYPILKASCTGCHGATNPTGSLDLSSETTAYTNLTTESSAETGCTEKYVVSGNASTSLLYQKVTGTSLPTKCGVKMPKGETALSAANITIIENWIKDGAAP